ncbi:hypothetical protein C2S51_037772 [Perilla frutescens var. frutescens]|nr:hypothetical protein C2S51_037772 [Perilla frutescens var. frutescens]
MLTVDGCSFSSYLTGNSLSGPVPDPKLNKGSITDLSYNNFTTSQSSAVSCGEGKPNLFANSKGNTTRGTFYCVTRNCKPNDYYSFHINCGSNQKVDDYEEDSWGDSKFFESSSSSWGFSSTGKFLNGETYGNSFIAQQPNNVLNSGLGGLYTHARLSPLSLTYFGFCLRNGNYTVNLHFAEIMFTDDTTYASLGRRIFDIYIQVNIYIPINLARSEIYINENELFQGILVRKDFNIAKVAGGAQKPIEIPFPAVVDDHTLEIRLYWAGKGTNALPERVVYGPLISAISVTHDYYRPSGNGLSAGAIVGIVIGLLFAVVLLAGILRWKRRKHSMHHDLMGLDLHTGSFTLRQIKAATNNFDPANKIGEGCSVRWYHHCREAAFFKIKARQPRVCE